MNETIDTLVVPVRLSAFCVNEKDAHDATPLFAGTNTVFTKQVGLNGAFLGANVNRSLEAPPAQPLEQGVHLHWTLPRVFTRASTGANGTLAFRPAPNRWLVSRFWLAGQTVQRRSWVVLSDFLHDAPTAGQVSITLPTSVTALGQNYQYSGHTQDFDASWREPDIPSERRFRTLAGMHLTAVASGQSAFAAFYPNCRGVFGFTDSLKDLTVSAGGEVELMYAVTGWFSEATLDPLAGGLGLEAMREQLFWTFDPADDGVKPSRSLYQGTVQGVVWHPDRPYLPDHGNGLPTVELDVSIGNNPPEAVACALQQATAPTVPYFQVLLGAYFEGLLGALGDPQPGQLAALEDALHQNGFQAITGGTIYAITRPETLQGTGGVGRGGTDLPLRLGDALNALNQQAWTVQRLEAELQSYDWQLFADWYRIFLSTDAQRQTCFNITYAKCRGHDALATGLETAQQKLSDQVAALTAQLPAGWVLEEASAPRYWRPTEPCFLLCGEGLAGTAPPIGGGGPNALLPCRLPTALVTAVTGRGINVTAADCLDAALPGSDLPSAAIFEALTVESLLLNASLLGTRTGQTLHVADVVAALAQPTPRLALTGTSPIPAAVAGWDGNPWIPVMAGWSVRFTPSFPTMDKAGGASQDYPAGFFTDAFTIDQNAGAAIRTTPASDPAAGPFGQTFTGVTYLSDSVIAAFARQLAGSDDPTLHACLEAISSQPMAVQTLSGLNAGLLMQQLSLQLNIAVPASSPYADLTRVIAKAAQSQANIAPDFSGFYNPIRSGCLQLECMLVDVYGQKKTVVPRSVNVAESLRIQYHGKPVPGIAWLPPRLSQAARLQFRFLAADGDAQVEMNVHPATSPICGWLLPEHLARGLFVYDAAGASLGSLFLNGDGSRILWQSAPGNDQTIDEDVETVMGDQQPQLRDLVVALGKATPAFFSEFLRAIDAANTTIEPQPGAGDADLAVLISRPLAVVQTSLALELLGSPQLNQSWSVLDSVSQANPLAETDNAFPQVRFPVILGNLDELSDGLVGYFKEAGDAYAFDRFFAIAAAAGGTNGVVPPRQDTVTVTAAQGPQRLLLLLDPRAAVHATTGILPTKSIRIPSAMYGDTLRSLEMTFLTGPVLRGGAGLALPLPTEAGRAWSWVQERLVEGAPRWLVEADVARATPDGLWSYTPQAVVEGWLRLNPDLLGFDLRNADGKAVVRPGVNDGLALVLTNRQTRAIGFVPGGPGPETQPPAGSVVYVHCGVGVPQDQVAQIRWRAEGWTFTFYVDAFYGAYWAATPSAPLTLDAGSTLQIAVDGFPVATDRQQVRLAFDYFAIGNLNDGTGQDTLAVDRSRRNPPA